MENVSKDAAFGLPYLLNLLELLQVMSVILLYYLVIPKYNNGGNILFVLKKK